MKVRGVVIDEVVQLKQLDKLSRKELVKIIHELSKSLALSYDASRKIADMYRMEKWK